MNKKNPGRNHSKSDSKQQALLEENRQLSEQVKRLVRLESQLHSAQEIMESQYQLYRQLHEAGKKLNNTLDLQEILAVATQFVLYEANFERSLILMLSENGEEFRVKGFDGYYEDEDVRRTSMLCVASNHPVLNPIWDGAMNLTFESGCQDAVLRELGLAFGMDEFVIFSLRGQTTRPAGLLIAGNRSESAEYYARVQKESHLIVTLASFAAQVSSVLRNVHLYSELEKEKKLLEIRVKERTRELSEAKEAIESASMRLKASEIKFRELVSRSLVGIFQTTPEGIVLEANPVILKTLGFESVERMNQVGLRNLYANADDRQGFVSAVSRGPVSDFETRFRCADGRIIDVSLSGNLVRDDSGKLRFIEGTFEDITEYKKAEEYPALGLAGKCIVAGDRYTQESECIQGRPPAGRRSGRRIYNPQRKNRRCALDCSRFQRGISRTAI